MYVYIYIYYFLYITYCDTCPGHLSVSPWQRRKFTCTQSPRTDRSQLRLLRRGLQKPQQHRVWWATTPEGSRLMFVPISFQKAVDRSARHTSTGHRTHCTQNGRRTGSRRTEEVSQTHWHHPFILLFNKYTLRGPVFTATCRVILQPATIYKLIKLQKNIYKLKNLMRKQEEIYTVNIFCLLFSHLIFWWKLPERL